MAELSTASILRISDEKTLQLIDLYFNEECLWNTKIAIYKNQTMRKSAAEKIATIMDLPNFTAKHAMMKIKNIRNSYSQEQKKIAHSIASGATGDNIYKPKVFWYSKLHSYYNQPLVQSRASEDEASIYRLDEDTEEWVQISKVEQALNPGTSVEEDHSGSEEDRSNDFSKKRKLSKQPKRTKAALSESLTHILQDIQSHVHVLTANNDDYHDSFGKYVASLLRSLPPQRALALQPQIVSLITSAELANDEEQPEFVECQSSQDNIVMKFERDE